LEKHSFCVDLKDISSIKFYGEPSNYLEIVLREGHQNRLLSSQDKDKSSAHSEIRLEDGHYKLAHFLHEGEHEMTIQIRGNLNYKLDPMCQSFENTTKVFQRLPGKVEAPPKVEKAPSPLLKAMQLVQGRKSPAAAAPPPAAGVAEQKEQNSLPAAQLPRDDDELPTLIIEDPITLSTHILKKIIAAGPTQYHLLDWTLLYRMTKHGVSVKKLIDFSSGAALPASIFIVKDSQGAVFGGFASHKWEIKRGFYGGGETFVWKVDPQLGLLLYYWTGVNDYFMLCTEEYIAFGGGDNFALQVDRDLSKGSSGACQTFNSPCLASGRDFAAIEIEIYTPLLMDL
jgi:hypothetical protein